MVNLESFTQGFFFDILLFSNERSKIFEGYHYVVDVSINC